MILDVPSELLLADEAATTRLGAAVARASIDRAGVGERVQILIGRGEHVLPTHEGGDPFDLVFIDADKESNTLYLDWAARLGRPGAVVVSDFASAEFAAVVVRKSRTGELDIEERDAVLADFDTWTRHTVRMAETTPNDIATAISFLRRRDVTLRAPDAINIALSQRLGASLATFDQRMARDAEVVGVATAPV